MSTMPKGSSRVFSFEGAAISDSLTGAENGRRSVTIGSGYRRC